MREQSERWADSPMRGFDTIFSWYTRDGNHRSECATLQVVDRATGKVIIDEYCTSKSEARERVWELAEEMKNGDYES